MNSVNPSGHCLNVMTVSVPCDGKRNQTEDINYLLAKKYSISIFNKQ